MKTISGWYYEQKQGISSVWSKQQRLVYIPYWWEGETQEFGVNQVNKSQISTVFSILIFTEHDFSGKLRHGSSSYWWKLFLVDIMNRDKEFHVFCQYNNNFITK